MSITLVLPFGDADVGGAAFPMIDLSARPARPMRTRVVLGLIDNGKLKADVLLTMVADVLKARGVVSDYFIQRKTPSATLPEADCEMIAERADIVISGLGDCGGCTACSTADALRCCARGALTFMLASEKFAFLVEATEREYGIAGLNRLYVEHPVWNRGEDWFASTAARLADEIATVVGTGSASTNDATDLREADIEVALADLRSGMDADGYDMDARFEDSILRIAVSARAGAGALCLMPQASFSNLVLSTLERAGVPLAAERVEIAYPEAV